ncbi:MAG: zinc-ribbon domain-containing protein [bacterium]|nr:zinc-ribbon domain-containing protein [bacterium]
MIEPFLYQSECLEKLGETRENGAKKALAVMASGLGKTVTSALDAAAWLQTHTGKVLYLCHQNDILSQARDTFRDVLGDGLKYGFFTGVERSAYESDVLFASLQTMRDHCQRFKPDEFAYVIIDESHHTPAPSYLKVIQYFTPQFLLGMTATPDRRDGLNIRALYGDEVYYLPLEEALARSLLTAVDYRLLSDEVSVERLDETDVVSTKQINERIFNLRQDEEVAATIARHSAELDDPRTIIFASNISRAEQLAKSIPGCAPIHSQVKIKERMVRVELFRLGLIKTVITVDCFNEGIDIPQANVVVFYRSTASPVIFFQQLGRGLRRCEGKKKVIVLDFVGNCERITTLKDLSDAITHLRKKREQRQAIAEAAEAAGTDSSLITFDEKMVHVLDVVKRIRRQRIADVPELAMEYSSRNMLTASFLAAKSRNEVWWKCGTCGDEFQMSPARRLFGDGCPQCKERVTEHNNLAVTHAWLAKEYSPQNPLLVTQIRASSKELVWWNCSECGHTWRRRPKNRTTQNDNCPACSALITHYRNNIGIRTPNIAEEYSYLNILAPSRMHWRSNKKVWWICNECHYEWMASVWSRAGGRSECPVCSPTTATDTNNIVRTHPLLADEYSSRNRRPIQTVFAGTTEKLWWLCSECGRYWDATVKERLDGKRCPTCIRTIQLHVSS